MRFVTPLQYEWKGWGDSSAAIIAMGLALAIAGLVQTLAVPTAQPVVAFELFVSLLIPTGLATGGYWLASRRTTASRPSKSGFVTRRCRNYGKFGPSTGIRTRMRFQRPTTPSSKRASARRRSCSSRSSPGRGNELLAETNGSRR